jgi:hypothetical protein
MSAGRLVPATLAMLALLSSPVRAQERTIAFVACPIVRDTSKVPCWLSEYDGETYYLGIQSDVSAPFNPPSLGHMALVEGVPQAGQRICGGIVLEPVKVSVMPEASPECDEVLMAEPRYELPFEPPRPPGPSGGSLAFAPPEPPPPPKPPYVARTFEIYFPFEGTLDFKTPGALQEVWDYAAAIGATRIRIEGHRAAVRLSDGTVLEERVVIGRSRAAEVARMFTGLVDTVDEVDFSYSERAEVGDWRRRKVSIEVIP